MNVDGMNLIFVDVEAIGVAPVTGLMTQFGAVHYHSRKSFHGLLHDSKPDPANPAKSLLTGPAHDGYTVMQAFASWCCAFEGRPIFVSDNNGFDAMWITCEFARYAVDNPFGHSSRRISDFFAGLSGDFRKTQNWKKWRVTPHTHHPVDDAMGNVEAFATMISLYDSLGPEGLVPLKRPGSIPGASAGGIS
jgi:hypothetical protein